MLESEDYLGKDAVELSAGIRAGDYSVVEVTECAINRAEKVESSIHSIVTQNFERALETAKIIDNSAEYLQKSILAGFPFLIKDLSTVKGLPATFGSNLFKDNKANISSNIVQKYLNAGLNIFGLTNTPEFGLTLTTEPIANGITRNPWNLEYSTGGSSGGAAAAVAAGISPVAHATDGGGSIRIPAACCGLFGLKPSRGLTAIENKLGDSWSGMSVGHVVSQSVRDSAAFLDIIKLEQANLFPLPPAPKSFLDKLGSEPRSLKIGLQLQHPLDQAIDNDCLDGVKQAGMLCESLGHKIEEINHPIDYGPITSAMSKLINTHIFQRVHARICQLDLKLNEADIETSTRIVAKLGSDVTAVEFLQARDLLYAAEVTMAQFHQSCDIIVSPVLTKTPAKLGWLNMNSNDMKEYTQRFRQYSGFTSIYNGTGQPSMSIPLHRSAIGLPVGVMFTGSWGSDQLLLDLASQLEKSQPWPRYVPNVQESA
ncbi:MAG: amidase [Pseudohongiellaceae bacterium]|uniref:Amidase n=1 Tax=OM182 bacterium MED-G28 TaxID=1986256 RepID=A0A2A5WD96_9GAMM|nr:MAG: amidase [OM182 bacterium MED-G28]